MKQVVGAIIVGALILWIEPAKLINPAGPLDWLLYLVLAFLIGAFALVPIYAIATWVFDLKPKKGPTDI